MVLVLSLVAVLSFGAAAKLKDGTYSLSGAEDSHGNYPTITLVVKGGKIDTVDYKEMIAKEKAPKSKSNYPYEAYFTAVETLNKKAVEVQGDVSKIDAVAGATHSSETFKDMLLAVQLQAAQLADREYPPIETAADSRGYKSALKLTVKNGKIVAAEYYEYNTANNKKKTKGEYNYAQYFDAIEELPKRLVAANGNLLEVDGFAGATSTTNNFMALARAYLNSLLLIAKK